MSHRRRTGHVPALLVTLACLITACAADPTPTDADVIIIGAGIAGLSAALEASTNGAEVLVVEISSVGGGHAIKAGGFALVGTPLQERKGFNDSPNIAYDDLMAWGEDADPEWVRLYVDNARTEIHDWLATFGIEFSILLDTPEDTVPRFHFAGGTAANVVVPMLREAVRRDNIAFIMNAAAERLLVNEAGIFSVRIRNTRSGENSDYTAPSVVITTGGFQSNLDVVKSNFRTTDTPHNAAPDSLLIGSGRYANGDGLRLGQEVGARVMRMDRQVTFVNGLTDPRDPQRGLHVENPAAIRIDSNGRRFVNESAPSKAIESAVMHLDLREHLLVFDANGRKRLRIRGAVWLNRDTLMSEILDNPTVVQKAETIAGLAAATGIQADSLQSTIDRYNEFVVDGDDRDFGRIDRTSKNIQPIANPPFYAIRLLPMTRKSMGGLAIDTNTNVTSRDNRLIDGLFAAGEVTGVAGINGSHGGSGTFLAPSVLTGRIAGRNAAATARRIKTITTDAGRAQHSAPDYPDDKFPMLAEDHARNLIRRERRGYWHWDRSHEAVLERNLACTDCHSRDWPTLPAMTENQQLLKLATCMRCH